VAGPDGAATKLGIPGSTLGVQIKAYCAQSLESSQIFLTSLYVPVPF
jgi:hypothetical protein